MKEWVVLPPEHSARWAEFGQIALEGVAASL